MTKKAKNLVCNIVALVGFVLLLGTAGSSDCYLIPTTQVILQGSIGMILFLGGIWLGGCSA